MYSQFFHGNPTFLKSRVKKENFGAEKAFYVAFFSYTNHKSVVFSTKLGMGT